MLAARRDLNRTFRALQIQQEACHERIDGLPERLPAGTWSHRIASEVRLLTELMLSLCESKR
jgi:hypothetical protein